VRRLLAAVLLASTAPVHAAAVDESAVAEATSHYSQGRFDQALALFLPAAGQGNIAAQYHVGLMYARGEGVARNLVEAARWFERAADGGHNHSQFLIGHMSSKGDGVPVDRVRAHMWFTAAAANGWWKAREAREKLVDAGMTPQEVTEAGKRYRAWEEGRAGR
jgi:TPR repeat protein